MALPPLLIEPLSEEVARLFTTDDLKRIMLKATGLGLHEEWVPDNLVGRQKAFALLEAVSRQDAEPLVLAEMLARRPHAAEFADLVGRACPEARAALPGTVRQVEEVISGLTEIRARLDEAPVRERLSQSRDRLSMIVDTVDSLDAYKSLHECLHQIQIKQFRALNDAARALPTDLRQAAELRVYCNQLRSACVMARSAVDQLPPAPIPRATETLWIDALEAAAAQVQDAIDGADPAGARSALRQIRWIIQNTPPRLNSLIFATASALPLDDLAHALEDVAGADGGEPIRAALRSLRLIIPTIRSEVVEHREWQEADIRITELDQLFERGGSGSDLIEEFAAIWIELKAMVQELVARDPDAAWARRILAYLEDVDDALAREQADASFEATYSAFRGEAQIRFLTVDSRLKGDCSALVRISLPLHRLLAELRP
ncbi:hypothetical protein LV780_11030 [Cereibacter azotoformans]|uniref:Uncharacterized protein n=1 Tax=Cereibacter azotoformans TaxID=43057 RepID=A0A2T5K7Q0_9RHOB|nr:hypothetical protein [Cereibacter azotoformans]AXQ94290.1 hypothetical protein D0Z66_11050 [Cereibacter sphaeroides]MBO4167893.1 hypothetical protein [Cereibacter azotoformans]PTR18455.1 hypothetical protein C8J28_108176 [Cereibacter azotoformans]UIJ29832.1 hypothetical protein LV780_11030 [Cereibacter azotoformans]